MGKWFTKAVTSVIMWGIASIMLLPFVWMLSSSLKTSAEVFQFPIEWIPKHPTLGSYKLLFSSKYNFGLYYFNTFIVTLMSIIGVVFVGSMTAYAYSKIRFAGRNFIFLLMIATLAIPFQVVMIPNFIIFRSFGLLDTLTSQWIGAFLNPIMAIFFLRQFFMTISNELIDAAKIDGCGHWRICWRIVVPLSKPVLFTVILIYFVSSWNNYETALLYLRKPDLYVISLAVKMFSGEMHVNHAASMAASVISIIPLLILLIFGQRYIISGLTSGAIKG
ncbi:carbohydrate ABC transporter permease [Paenibacillus eucommiae]|uniref:Multiple sugar transport system permease protein n=1 Tax=Paenibacillus eucommiae TaxID=1355755 RepID=A0ABS4ISW3_9BACL|nr:carbohydrate ABC transporter permease [Paenibacillus eucommiae]MBP1990662.1 multiple sugar transport system permease protein [Paenibacillus eucommiae]